MSASNYSAPLIILITGASGAGKTTVLKEIDNQLSERELAVHYFDSIGVPSFEDMIKDYGSPEKWQEAMTERWIERLIQIQNKSLVFLEGQFNPNFAIKPLRNANIKRYLLFCLHAERPIRDRRLISLRNQPELADDNMQRWAEVLKQKTIELNGIVIETSNKEINQIALEMLSIIQLKMK